MSEQVPNGGELDFDSIFGEMMDGFKHDSRDPLVTNVLEDALRVQADLRKRTPSDELIEDCCNALNDALDQAELLDEAVLVSGKVRPHVDKDDDGTFHTDDLPEEFEAFGELKYDENGPYYEVSGMRLMCGVFDVDYRQRIDNGGNERSDIALILCLDTFDYRDDEGEALYVFLEDLDILTIESPSYLKINEIVNEKYPGIAEQLELLPADCGNDRKIIKALSTFRLAIDWAQHPEHSDEDKKRLLAYIESYITNRVMFDSHQYSMSVRGEFYAEDKRGNETDHFVEDTQRINGTIERVHLEWLEDESEGSANVFGAKIEVLAPTETRGGGSYRLYIPAWNISYIRNHRNVQLFPASERDELAVVDDSYTESVSPAPSIDFVSKLIDGEALLASDSTEIAAHESYLASVHERWQALLADARRITSRAYDHESQAMAARDDLYQLVVEFSEGYHDNADLEIEAEGPGVFYVPATIDQASRKYDEESDTEIVQFKDLRVRKGDVQTPMRGTYGFHSIAGVRASADQPGKFEVDGLILFNDTQPSQPIVFNAQLGVPLYELHQKRSFIVRLDNSEANITIPEYERLKRCREGIGKIATRFPDLTFLPWQLTELHQVVDNADPTAFESVDVSLVSTIGEHTGGDELAVSRTVDVLSDILKEKLVDFSGPAYTMDGTYHEFISATGMVGNVISTNNNIASEEPMLVVLTIEGDAWCVPLSTVETFRC